jgi:hypothetical protein
MCTCVVFQRSDGSNNDLRKLNHVYIPCKETIERLGKKREHVIPNAHKYKILFYCRNLLHMYRYQWIPETGVLESF